MIKMTKQTPAERQISEYLDYCQFTRHMSQMTLVSKRHTFKHFIIQSSVKDLRDLDNRTFDRWIKSQIKRQVSARSINTRIAHLVAMLRYHRDGPECADQIASD